MKREAGIRINGGTQEFGGRNRRVKRQTGRKNVAEDREKQPKREEEAAEMAVGSSKGERGHGDSEE